MKLEKRTATENNSQKFSLFPVAGWSTKMFYLYATKDLIHMHNNGVVFNVDFLSLIFFCIFHSLLHTARTPRKQMKSKKKKKKTKTEKSQHQQLLMHNVSTTNNLIIIVTKIFDILRS